MARLVGAQDPLTLAKNAWRLAPIMTSPPKTTLNLCKLFLNPYYEISRFFSGFEQLSIAISWLFMKYQSGGNFCTNVAHTGLERLQVLKPFGGGNGFWGRQWILGAAMAHWGRQWLSGGGNGSVVMCPPLNWKIGCWIHGHWVNCRSAPCARAFTSTVPGRGTIQA